MIITCPNCIKQFKIDNSLIPDEGRDLQCGSCNNIWFYKIEEQNNDLLKLDDEIISKDIEITDKLQEKKLEESNQPLEKIKSEKNNELKEKNSEKQKNKTLSKNTGNKESKFFSYLIVIIISSIALIVLLDTLKTPLINVFPRFEIIPINC